MELRIFFSWVYNTHEMHIKQLLKKVVEKKLQVLVAIKLARTRPTIIGITGSFGKTTTKEAIYEVLKTSFRTYRNPKSLNTEIGLLLAVLEQPSGFSSPVKWARVLAGAFYNAFAGRKYDFLILEYGADKPGDIKHLVSLVKPDIGIITHIANVHHGEGQFKNIEEVLNEKKKLVTCLDQNGTAILNADDVLLNKIKGELKAKILWFGTKGNISAGNIKNSTDGFSATVHTGEQSVSAEFPIAGDFHINSILPALLCGALNGISLEKGIEALQNFRLPPGRMSIIKGKNGSTLIDSTYNASPSTMKQALELLKNFPKKKRIAVLGNMNELGPASKSLHREVGEHIGEWVSKLVTVGTDAALFGEVALKNGLPKARIASTMCATDAAAVIAGDLDKDTVVLLKGSQNNVRLERAVKMLMAHPEDAKKLLCRQEKEWERI